MKFCTAMMFDGNVERFASKSVDLEAAEGGRDACAPLKDPLPISRPVMGWRICGYVCDVGSTSTGIAGVLHRFWSNASTFTNTAGSVTSLDLFTDLR